MYILYIYKKKGMEKCFICKKEGHTREACPDRCKNDCKDIHRTGNCPKDKSRIANISRSESLTCGICKKDGHSEKDCLEHKVKF